MVKPNTKFELTVEDVELIEKALYNAIAYYSQKQDFDNVTRITELLGKIHNQKNWYRPTEGYVGG